MRIVDVTWQPAVNMLVLRCECGERFEHRADRWKATCPRCKRTSHLSAIRDEWVARHRHAAACASE